MKLAGVVVALICALGVHAQDPQDNNTAPEYPQMPDFSTPFAGMMGNQAGAIAALQGQQLAQNYMGKFVIELQTVLAWMQASKAYARMALDEQKNVGGGMLNNLEEDSESEDEKVTNLRKSVARNLEMAPGPNMLLPGGQNPAQNPFPAEQNPSDPDADERNFEMSLLYITKLMYIDSIYKLDDAQKSHYQTKVMLLMIAPVAQGNPYVSQLLYMLWYKDIIAIIKSAIFIQMQDTWTFWLYNDIMETNEFDKSRYSELPETFERTLLHSGATAMQQWYMHSLLELQTLYLNYYVNMLLMQMMQMAGQTQQPAAASFLEEGASAQSLPSMGGSALPMYFIYFQQMLKLWAKVLEFQTSGAFYTFAAATVQDLGDTDPAQTTIQNGAFGAPGVNMLNGNYLGTSGYVQQNGVQDLSAQMPALKLYATNTLQMWVWVRAMDMFIQMWLMAIGAFAVTQGNSLGASMGGSMPSFGSSFGPGYGSYIPQGLVQTDEATMPAVEQSPVQAPESAPVTAPAAAPEQPAAQPSLVG